MGDHRYPDPLKDPKNGNSPNMNPLLHWGNQGIIRGFHFLDPLGGLGSASAATSDGFKDGMKVEEEESL